MALSIITDKFRIENAKKFIQGMKVRSYPSDFSTTTVDYEQEKSSKLNNQIDNMYMIIGKITSWYGDGVETPIPEVSNNLRQESEVWANAIAAKVIDRTDISHVTFRENWTYNTEYPYYSSIESNSATFSNTAVPNFYVLDEEEFRVYKCLFNNYGSNSLERPTDVGGVGGDPTRIQREPFYTSDGYLWKYMYTIDPALAISFLTDEYMPLRKDLLNTPNSSADGAVYRIILSGKDSPAQTIESPSTDNFVRVRVEGIDSSTDITTSRLAIDISNPSNAGRIAAAVDNDMVGYQVEHVIDTGDSITIEIAEITASSISSGTTLNLTVTRLDDHDATQFTVPASGTETWFISPLIHIRGGGNDASAMLQINGETVTSAYRLIPTSASTSGTALDVIMNTAGSGYNNVFVRNDYDGTLESLVVIKQGIARLGQPVPAQTVESDREIYDMAEIVSITPYGGHSYDNVSELFGYTIMINQTFSGNESGSATVLNDFRQVALVQNPLEQDGTLADATIYRQSIRIEFTGNVTNDIDVDDEISDQTVSDGDKTIYGRVVRTEYLSTDNVTQVYLSSTFGFMSKTGQEVYDINDLHELYVSYDSSSGTSPYTALTLSSRITTAGEGAYQKGLSSNDDTGLDMLSGDMFYVENRTPIIRAADQSENVKLVIEY